MQFNGTDLHDAIYAEDADRVQMLLANPSTDVNLANDVSTRNCILSTVFIHLRGVTFLLLLV